MTFVVRQTWVCISALWLLLGDLGGALSLAFFTWKIGILIPTSVTVRQVK